MAVAVDGSDEAAEDHVDACCVEDGRDHDEGGLDGVGGDEVGVVVAGYAGCVAEDLDRKKSQLGDCVCLRIAWA